MSKHAKRKILLPLKLSTWHHNEIIMVFHDHEISIYQDDIKNDKI